MKNNHKILLVKFVISTSALLMIITIYFLWMLERTGETTYNYQFYEKWALIFYIFFALFTVLLIILMSKIDIRSQKTIPKKYKIKVKNEEELKKYLSETLFNNGYDINGTFIGDLYKINYFIKQSYKQSYIVGILKIEELTEEIYDKYKENYFEDFGNYLLENNQLNVTDDFNLIYIICVDRLNPTFRKYINSNIKQYWARFILPVGISFGSKSLYISTQKSGFARNKYKKLFKLFNTYIDDIKIDKDLN